ncbi:hypothetical protein BGZ63DRAFT_450681 [Mariannaea sp. PMI_226]|nr:hypothetical protein BGZ63DRAFT_450681 [Mariannaea sp. PMI_226]
MSTESPRGVSSRLLTMKFMQRAAASASSTASSDSDAHSTKKRKLGHSPSEGRVKLNIDQAAIQAAINDQESKRQAALEKHIGADTHWVLNNDLTSLEASSTAKTPLNIVYVGYGDIDSDDESGDQEDVPAQGRTSTRKSKETSKSQNPKSEKSADGSERSSDEEDSDVSDDESTPRRPRATSNDSPHSQSSRSRSQSRLRNRASQENIKAKEFREKRKKKEVKLSKLTSISAGGGSQFSSPTSGKSMTCFKCQQVGHRAVDCPRSGGRQKR